MTPEQNVIAEAIKADLASKDTITRISEFISRVGVPTAAAAALMAIVYVFGSRLVDGHLEHMKDQAAVFREIASESKTNMREINNNMREVNTALKELTVKIKAQP